MSLQNALKTVTLKSTGVDTSSVTQTAPVSLLCENSEQYKGMMHEATLEQYFKQIEEFTFKSVFTQMTREDATAIREAFKIMENGGNAIEAIENNSVLSNLAEKVNKCIVESKWPTVFIRLSTRSPKDAALCVPGFCDLYEEDIAYITELDKKFGFDSYAGDEDNRKLHALYRTSTRVLGVNNGVSAVSLLISSSRIQDDLLQFIECATKDNLSSPFAEMQLAIREFSAFEVHLEFRAFVHKGVLTAITQYNTMNDEVKSTIQKRCEELFVAIKSRITSLDSYVLDLVFVPQNPAEKSDDLLQNTRLVVIELNPLAEFAGSGLFQWEVAADRAVLCGKAPFEFRVVDKVPQFAIKEIPKAWRKAIGE